MTHLKWERGGEGAVVSLEADAITLRSTVPAPPGARIQGVLEALAGQAILVKVHGSKKQPDGSFVIEGRCIDMTRDLRVSICALLETAEK